MKYLGIAVGVPAAYSARRRPRLKPGEYRLIAWEDIPQGAWLDPAFRQRFEGLQILSAHYFSARRLVLPIRAATVRERSHIRTESRGHDVSSSPDSNGSCPTDRNT